ncbi:MAG: tyrosine-type recombinase/integrase, partial [Deltaproteobacteria bacterium]|nr:tyrosine-type recombinase/integrase [Deltaproteobacteria bacterium]
FQKMLSTGQKNEPCDRLHFASHLVSNGVDLYTVGRLLTHKQTSTTARYAHLSDQRVRQAAELSAGLLKPKQESKKVVNLFDKSVAD